MTKSDVLDTVSPVTFASIIAGPNSPGFGAALLDAARHSGPIVETFAFAWSAAAGPRLIAVHGTRPGATRRAQTYLERYFHHDPMLFQHRGTEAGRGFCESYSAAEIGPGEYRKRCFTEPGFAEKISFGWRWPRELTMVSFYSEKAGIVHLEQLHFIANTALAAAGLERPISPTNFSRFDILTSVRNTAPSLSDREAEVCVLTILGYRSDEIAEKLKISATSVLTYRRRAYQKAEVSHAGALLRSE